MANDEHVALLKQGVDAWNKWRYENPNVVPDLFKADLFKADLILADLSKADLSKADLSGAKLYEAHLGRTKLSAANLFEATLSGATLTWADLTAANLFKADDRVNNQPPPGADAQGNIKVYKSKDDIPPEAFNFEIIGDDEDPADISDINDWDDI